MQNNDLQIENDCYLFKINTEKFIDARTEGNMGRFLNHSTYAYNTEYYLDGDQIALRAVKTIHEGEQFLAPYGKDFNFAAYCFLYPTDNSQSPKQLHAQNKKHYASFSSSSSKYNLEPLGISKSATHIYAPTPILALLKNSQAKLPKLAPDYPMHLPILQLNAKKRFVDFRDQERITALMVAAYMGNADAIHHLFNAQKNPYADMQQSKSGRTALHLLFLGAQIDTSSEMRKKRQKAVNEFFKIRSIKNILNIKDKDGKSPLFTAIDHAPPALLQSVIEIKKVSLSVFLNSCTPTGLDPFLYAISEKKYEHALILLNAILTTYSNPAIYFETLEPASRGIIKLLVSNLSNMLDIAAGKNYSPAFFAEPLRIALNERQTVFISDLIEKLGNDGCLHPRQPQVGARDLKLAVVKKN